MSEEKTRYNDAELEEFRQLIEQKLASARADYDMLRDAALRLKKTGTQDGNTLFVNVHLSPDSNHSSIIFPTTYETPISIRHAHLLMDMSSAIPPQLEGTIIDCRKTYSKGPYVAMSYNTSISEIITVLNIGSRSFVMGL